VQRSQIIVQAKINGSGPYDFLVDTSAEITTIDPSLEAISPMKLVNKQLQYGRSCSKTEAWLI
jgi:hypothetical protein